MGDSVEEKTCGSSLQVVAQITPSTNRDCHPSVAWKWACLWQTPLRAGSRDMSVELTEMCFLGPSSVASATSLITGSSSCYCIECATPRFSDHMCPAMWVMRFSPGCACDHSWVVLSGKYSGTLESTGPVAEPIVVMVLGSAAPWCIGNVSAAMSSCSGSFSPDGSYESALDSVTPTTKTTTPNDVSTSMVWDTCAEFSLQMVRTILHGTV